MRRPDVGAWKLADAAGEASRSNSSEFQSKNPHDCWTAMEVCCAKQERFQPIQLQRPVSQPVLNSSGTTPSEDASYQEKRASSNLPGVTVVKWSSTRATP